MRAIFKLLPCLVFLVPAVFLRAQPFTEITAISEKLIHVETGNAVWGDIDGDRDLDILLAGIEGVINSRAEIYRNDSGAFYKMYAMIPQESSGALVDVNHDGKLEIFIHHFAEGGKQLSDVYAWENEHLQAMKAELPYVSMGSFAWGDYDADGDEDIVFSGRIDGGFESRIYLNDSGSFLDILAPLKGLWRSSCTWADYDLDGDLDLFLAGADQAGHAISKLYKNEEGSFQETVSGIPGVLNGAADWGDFDKDGDPDLVLSGCYNKGDSCKIFRNDASTFTDIGAVLPGARGGSVDWGDYDNDGDPDILLTGGLGNWGGITEVFENKAGVFTPLNAGLIPLRNSSAQWGDYDNDGNLDILVMGGMLNSTRGCSKVYCNERQP